MACVTTEASASPVLPPAPSTAQMIKLSGDDTLASLQARLAASSAPDVRLFVPADARLFRRPLDFRVLRRIATALGLSVTIVTDDPLRRRLAHAHRFPVSAAGGPPWRALLRGALAALAGLAALGGLGASVPRAVVTIEPVPTLVTETVPITIDLRPGAPGISRGWVPGQPVAVAFELTQSQPTTGQQRVGHTPARGHVTIRDLRPLLPPSPPPPSPTPTTPLVMSDAPARPTPIPLPTPLPERVLPAGTIVQASTGTRYTTQTDVRLWPGSYAHVAVVAVEPGEGGNQPAGALTRFEDPALTDLSVTNPTPIWGGTDRLIPLVAAPDRAQLSETLQRQAAAEAAARLRAQAGDGLVLLDETVTWTADEEFDYAVGQPTAALQARAVVRARGVAVPRVALEDAAGRRWRDLLPSSLAPVDSPRLVGPVIVQEQAEDHLVATVALQGTVAPRVNPQMVAEVLRGQPLAGMRSRLHALPGLDATSRVEVWPPWAPGALRVDVVVASTQ
ncbi:MAG: baseplate J/gp47 family protein [Chloroflexi bacterium]|nr:baseplate J/gp47 family protein [Chloroflexota bacterium]